MKFPLLSDFKKEIARDYGVLIEEAGVALRLDFRILGVLKVLEGVH